MLHYMLIGSVFLTSKIYVIHFMELHGKASRDVTLTHFVQFIVEASDRRGNTGQVQASITIRRVQQDASPLFIGSLPYDINIDLYTPVSSVGIGNVTCSDPDLTPQQVSFVFVVLADCFYLL